MSQMLQLIQKSALANSGKAAAAVTDQQLVNRQRHLAFSFLQKFTRFAADECGCPSPSNRAYVKRSVFYATATIKMDAFVNHSSLEVEQLKLLSKMECPVTLPNKAMLTVKANESAAGKILQAAKRLRRHFDLSESQTCRGCSKRSRCRWFKRLPSGQGSEVAAGGDVARVLFGLAQYCRIHLQDPDNYPLDGYSEETFASADHVLEALAEYMKSAARERQNLTDLPSTDLKTARQILMDIATKIKRRKDEHKTHNMFNMPPWMLRSLSPTNEANLTPRQKWFLRQQNLAQSNPDPKTPEHLQWEWISEETLEEEKTTNIAPDSSPGHMSLPDGEIVKLDNLDDIPVKRRFDTTLPVAQQRQVIAFNAEYRGYVKGMYRTKGNEDETTFNLQEYADSLGITDEDILSPDAVVLPEGGYTIADVLTTDMVKEMPNVAAHLVAASADSLKGVQKHPNIS